MKNTSTSSSSAAPSSSPTSVKAPPNARWITSLMMALVCTFIVLAGYEGTLRASGFEPNFRDNPARWAEVRDAAGKDKSLNAIALLGASRIRSSVSLAELESRFPEHGLYPLGFPSRNPCGALKDLAQSTEFRGTVILSMNANWVDCRPGRHQMHDIIERYHQEWNWARKLDTWAANLVTQSFVFTDADYSIRSMIDNALDHGSIYPRQGTEVTRKNRQIELNFSAKSEAELSEMRAINRGWFRGRAREGSRYLRAQWETELAALSDAIETISARGGQVVIVRFPTSGALRAAELDYFPREDYWDDLARKLPASAILHFEDYPALSGFELPDESHLDYCDAARFTRVLFDIIEQEGVVLTR